MWDMIWIEKKNCSFGFYSKFIPTFSGLLKIGNEGSRSYPMKLNNSWRELSKSLEHNKCTQASSNNPMKWKVPGPWFRLRSLRNNPLWSRIIRLFIRFRCAYRLWFDWPWKMVIRSVDIAPTYQRYSRESPKYYRRCLNSRYRMMQLG